MYVRFVSTRKHQNSSQPQGLFSAAYEALNDVDLTPENQMAIDETLAWFATNLRVPRHDDTRRAVFWYRATATEFIRRMWDLKAVLEAHGYIVSVMKCRKLGNILWGDQHQVWAYPSRRDVHR